MSLRKLRYALGDIHGTHSPYRAQRRKIADELRSVGAPESIVSTVHRAQGSERQIVIFDPVCPTAEFVAGAEGMRLVNVAFSRAKCRLIIMLQRGWESHPAIRMLAEQHSPRVLDGDEIDRLLLKKLPHAPAAKLPEKVASPKPAIVISGKTSVIDDFRDELRNKIRPGASKGQIQRAALDLRDKAKYRKLLFGEIEAAVQDVLRNQISNRSR